VKEVALVFSPDGLCFILTDLRVSGQDGQVLQLSLGHNQPVKGVPMIVGKSVYVQGMSHAYRQALDGVEGHLLKDKRLQIVGQVQLAQSDLGGYLPTTGGAEEQLILAVTDDVAGMSR